MAKAYLRRDNRTVGAFIPESTPQRAEIPQTPPLASLLANFKPGKTISAAEVFEPTPANLEHRTQRRQIGNLQVALLPKKTRGETVRVAFTLHSGDEKSLFGMRWPAHMAASLLYSGTTRYSRDQIADELRRLKIKGSLFSFETTRSYLTEALALVVHLLRESAFPDSEFEQTRKAFLASYDSTRDDPASQANEAMALHFSTRYPKGDVRTAVSQAEDEADLKALTLGQVKEYFRDFSGASKGELAIVGDFDVEPTVQHVAKLFANWETRRPYTRIVNTYEAVMPLFRVIHTPEKENGTYLAGLSFAMNVDDEDFPALFVANRLLGDSGLDSRLMQRVRQKEGLSYGIGTQLAVDDIDRIASFSISASAAPQNLGKVAASVKDELTRIAQTGFTPQEVAKAQSGLAEERGQDRASDAVLVSTLLQRLPTGRTFIWSQQLDERLAKLTPAEVNAAFRKYIQADQLTVIIARDEVKAGLTAK